ncbi:unnamed protein product [Allacma fusca]|uniref:Uncharacterized protein n=1 Tax=Allacma fusca TaxID=39272 RepID=A0A8J2LCS2_9HEXA|nr:unnamed protein product [Allacma fusca]
MNTFAFVIFQVLCLTECSKVYEEIHSKYLENELLDWVPPEEYRNNFTYYLSGYGYDGVPLCCCNICCHKLWGCF